MSADTKALKKALRKEIGARRALAHGKVDPKPALDALIAALRGAQGPISFFWPIRTEIDVRPAMHVLSDTHEVCLPVTHGFGPLTFRLWSEGTAIETDGFGVSTPDATSPDATPQTLVVPMLAFDAACHRLGYGAGHYDRTIANLKQSGKVLAIGFAYAAQQVDELLPIDATDQSLDMIITENGICRPRA